MEEELKRLINEYLERPFDDTKLPALRDHIRLLQQNAGTQSELLRLLNEQWLPQLVQAADDNRIAAILNIFVENGITLPAANPVATDLLPLYAHAKNRADLRLDDFLRAPTAPVWEDVFSDHKPQVIHCTREANKGFPVITYNVGQSGALMIGDVMQPGNSLLEDLAVNRRKTDIKGVSSPGIEQISADTYRAMFERRNNNHAFALLVAQKKTQSPVLLLQEVGSQHPGIPTEEFLAHLKAVLTTQGSQWEYEYDADRALGFFYDKTRIQIQSSEAQPITRDNFDKIVSYRLKYDDEDVVISNVHLAHKQFVQDGEPSVEETLKKFGDTEHFVCGDFNRRLAPTNDVFRHSGTNTFKYIEQRGFDYTDGGFTLRNGKVVRLDADILDEKTGDVVQGREVSVEEALANDTYNECVFANNYSLNGFYNRLGDLAEKCDCVVEKNIYNVARVKITATEDIEADIAAKFPYYEYGTEANQYIVYPNPQVMQLKRAEEVAPRRNLFRALAVAFAVIGLILAVLIPPLLVVYAGVGVGVIAGLVVPGAVSLAVSARYTQKVIAGSIEDRKALDEYTNASEMTPKKARTLSSSAVMARSLSSILPPPDPDALQIKTGPSQEQIDTIVNNVENTPPAHSNDKKWLELSAQYAKTIKKFVEYLDEGELKNAADQLAELPQDIRREITTYFYENSETYVLLNEAIASPYFQKQCSKEVAQDLIDQQALLPTSSSLGH